MFIERYFKEPIKYAMLDWKKIFVGGVFGLIFYISIDLLSLILPDFSLFYQLSIVEQIIAAILGILALLGLMLLIIQTGYLIKIAKNTVDGGGHLPKWENFKDLFLNGIKWTVGMILLGIIIFAIPTIVLGIGIYLYISFIHNLSGAHGNLPYNIPPIGAPEPLVWITFIFAILLYMVGFVIYTIYEPLATVNFAKKGFKGFFEFKYILKLMSLEYLLLVIIYIIGIFIIISAISMIFAIFGFIFDMVLPNIVINESLNIIGESVVAFISFFIYVVYYKSFSNYYVDKINKIK
jgi:hypothetical protein